MRNYLVFILAGLLMLAESCDKVSESNSASATTGSTGSLSRFITAGNYLYVVDYNSLKTYQVSTPGMPVYKSTTTVGFNIETIFYYNGKLFIGSAENLFIYSVANPAAPAKVSQIPYFVRGKDPVVVKDSVAYSTVRINNGGSLYITDIRDINNPVVQPRIGVPEPYGLGISGNNLYVCEGSSGIEVFNISNQLQPVSVRRVDISETCYDVIIDGNLLICYIKGGLAFLNIANPASPVLISTVKN